MGIRDELAEAARAAIRQMIDQICLRSTMGRTAAYMLCSPAGDLRITQLVDGNKGVHIMLDKSILEPDGDVQGKAEISPLIKVDAVVPMAPCEQDPGTSCQS